jgi:hypothetical protein
MSVAAHPDFQGRGDKSRAGQADQLVQPPSTGPEICDYFAIPPAECLDALAQLQDHGLPAKQS